VHHLLDVGIAVLVEEAAVVVLLLGRAPGVERLDHQQQSQLVAEPHELRRRRVVRRADGVRAHPLHGEQLLPDAVLGNGGTQCAERVVQVDARSFEYLPFSEKPSPGSIRNQRMPNLVRTVSPELTLVSSVYR
jgi:hypothetical protein